MNVTALYERMISAFSCDFQLAQENLIDFSIDEMLVKNANNINLDIELLNELEYKIRYGKLKIIEIESEETLNDTI